MTEEEELDQLMSSDWWMARSRGWKPVIRSDGVEYKSLTAAAEAVGHPVSCISDVVRGRHKTCAGFGWRYK